MKKILLLTFLLTVVVVMLFCAPVSSVAFADGEATVTIRYKGTEETEFKDLTEFKVPIGEKFESLPSYGDLIDLGVPSSELEEQKLIYYVDLIGTEFDPDSPIAGNVTLYLIPKLIDENDTVTYTYVYYDYSKPEPRQEEVVTYPLGKMDVFAPSKVGNIVISVNAANGETGFYLDRELKNGVYISRIAYENKVYYVKLQKAVTVTVNDKVFTLSYGADLSAVTGINPDDGTRPATHHAKAFFFDKEKTNRYLYTAANGLTLYADYVHTHYLVRFQNGENYLDVPVAIGEDGKALVTEADFPQKEGIKAVEWRVDERKDPPEYPLSIDKDITLYASNGLRYGIDAYDRLVLYPIMGAIIAMAIWAAVYEHRKTKRKKLMQSAQSPDNQPETNESDAPAETNETENTAEVSETDSPAPSEEKSDE